MYPTNQKPDTEGWIAVKNNKILNFRMAKQFSPAWRRRCLDNVCAVGSLEQTSLGLMF